MADHTFLLKEEGKYLWYGLLQLGIENDPDKQKSRKQVDLGPDMFNKPNRDAFHVVILFLLKKLDKDRVAKDYKYCWPVVSPKDDAEFRKLTGNWVKEIMGTKSMPSLFLSPGGPKFISLMLDLVKHVMLKQIKAVETDGSWVPEAAMLPASSLHMARMRLKMVRNRLGRTARAMRDFNLEYHARVDELVKSKMECAKETAKCEELIADFNDSFTPDAGSSLAEELEKGRALFAETDRMLKVTEDGEECVESAIRIMNSGEDILDGEDIELNIPRSLRERVERLPHLLSSGNVYRDGKLNFLSLLELGHCALQQLVDQRLQVPAAGPVCQPQDLEENHSKMSKMEEQLRLFREDFNKMIPEVRDDVLQLESLWDRKWAEQLKEAHRDSFLEDPSIPDRLSFELDSAAGSESVFSLYPATLQDWKPPGSDEDEDGVQTVPLNPQSGRIPDPPTPERAATPAPPDQAAAPSSSTTTTNTSLVWFCDSPPTQSVQTPPLEASVMKAAPPVPMVTPLRTTAQILDLECDTLADQLAEAVTSAGPAGGSRTATDFMSLLNTLHQDPFSARKQIPRTPESLLKDVRSSWRKVLEEDEKAKKGDLSFKGDGSTKTAVFESPTPMVSQQPHPGRMYFSLADETLPELPSDSLLSLEDDSGDTSHEHQPLNPEAERPPQTQHHQLLVQLDLSPEPVKPVEGEEAAFSLDLDQLETPKRLEFSLPQLITFSPIDDL